MSSNSRELRFSLKDSGVIYAQPDLTNPTPGEPVAEIRKGEGILAPAFSLLESNLKEQKGAETLAKEITEWIPEHLKEILYPLPSIDEGEDLDEATRNICLKLKESMGTIPRQDIEEFVKDLTPETRAALRARKVRMGPVLVFIPSLGKPAAVRLRALLWTLWNEKPLPAPAPADGIVSFAIEKDSAGPLFYRAIGYPVFGPRAIRIDMLDRVIGSIYDSAEKGMFRAKHEMAEWLGSSIPDLYAVLEAMGHKKIQDPAKEKPAETDSATETPTEKEKVETTETPPPSAETPETKVKEESTTEAVAEPEPKEPQKPELALFRLKKGKASGPAKTKRPYKKQQSSKNQQKKSGDNRKPRRKDNQPRVISASAKTNPEDSPFAILQQLKNK